MGADGPYWAALSAGRLELPRCSGCGRWHWPAPFRCPDCGSQALEWVAREPAGLIYSWTRTWHRFDGVERFPIPFVSVLVEVPDAGGIRLLGRFDDAAVAPAIGKPVRGSPFSSEVFGRTIPTWYWQAEA
jgi:uncharacterized OB-fold protein